MKAAVHVTGGGIPGNLTRVLPEGCGARLDGASWRWPEVFAWLAEAGAVSEAEMLRSFNCGLGMLLVTSPEDAEAVQRAADASFEAWCVGTVVAGAKEVRVEKVALARPLMPKAVRVAVLISGTHLCAKFSFFSSLKAILPLNSRTSEPDGCLTSRVV